MNTGYSIPKPTLSPAVYMLGTALFIGLLGLGLVAFHVFDMVDNPVVAACFALVIELGAVSEAIGIIRKNRPAIAGAVISLLVSGSYNVTRIEAAGLELAGWQAWSLAIGPLSAVLFLALSLSHELQQHEAAVLAWEKARQIWQDAQAEKEARRMERREARQEKQAVQLAQAAQAESAKRVQLHTAQSVAGPDAQRGSYEGFYAAQIARNGSGPMDYKQVMDRFNVSRRTAYNWLDRYNKEHPVHVVHELN